MSVNIFYRLIQGKTDISKVKQEIKIENKKNDIAMKKLMNEQNKKIRERKINNMIINFKKEFNNDVSIDSDDDINILKSVFYKIFPEQYKDHFKDIPKDINIINMDDKIIKNRFNEIEKNSGMKIGRYNMKFLEKKDLSGVDIFTKEEFFKDKISDEIKKIYDDKNIKNIENEYKKLYQEIKDQYEIEIEMMKSILKEKEDSIKIFYETEKIIEKINIDEKIRNETEKIKMENRYLAMKYDEKKFRLRERVNLMVSKNREHIMRNLEYLSDHINTKKEEMRLFYEFTKKENEEFKETVVKKLMYEIDSLKEDNANLNDLLKKKEPESKTGLEIEPENPKVKVKRTKEEKEKYMREIIEKEREKEKLNPEIKPEKVKKTEEEKRKKREEFMRNINKEEEKKTG